MKAFSDCGHLLTGPSGRHCGYMEALTHISSVSIQKNLGLGSQNIYKEDFLS